MLPAVGEPARLPFSLGDFEGHPFRGNQYSDVAGEGGGGGGSSSVASRASAYATEPRIFAQPHEIASVSGWPGEAVRHGWLDPETGKSTGRLLTGEPLTREQIPDTLYHVTTNAPAVHSSGVLLGQVDGGGLGGGQANGVSFTTSKEDAQVIQRELRRAIQIARGDLDVKGMLEQFAREDEKEAGVPAGTLKDAVTFAKEMWDGNAFTVDHDWQEDPTGKYADEDRGKTYGHIKKRTPEDRERIRRSLLKDTFNAYLQMRGHQDKAHPLLKNPILFAQQEKLAKLSPDDVQTLTIPSAQIPAKALVTTGSDDFLHEVRAYADVPLARATTLAARHARGYALGGPGSGNFGHAGRPGEIGGSSDDGRGWTDDDERRFQIGDAARTHARSHADARGVASASAAIIQGNDVPAHITEAQADAAKILVQAIRDAPEDSTTLFRGLGAEEEIASLENVKVGDKISLGNISSFSERQDFAAYYAERASGGSVGYTYELRTDGPVKSIATDAHTDMGHKEHLIQGIFEVVGIDEPRTGVQVLVDRNVTGSRKFYVFHNRSIKLKQVGVF